MRRSKSSDSPRRGGGSRDGGAVGVTELLLLAGRAGGVRGRRACVRGQTRADAKKGGIGPPAARGPRPPPSHFSLPVSLPLFMPDLALVDLDPAAPPPPRGSLLTLRPADAGGWDVLAGATFLGRLPPDTPEPGPGTTVTVRSVRRAPDGGGLVAVLVRLSVGSPAPPVDDAGVRPVARRRGEGKREGERAKKKNPRKTIETRCGRRENAHDRSPHTLHRPRPAGSRPGPGRPAVSPDQGGLRRAR